jgi:hypothetical protein
MELGEGGKGKGNENFNNTVILNICEGRGYKACFSVLYIKL